MTESPADPSAPAPSADGWLAEPRPSDGGWSQKKFLGIVLFVLAVHVALVFLFGTKKQAVPRPVTNVPHLQLADDANEFIRLGDPTLFARPNEHDLVTAFWRQLPPVHQPNFNWTEAPHYLPPVPDNFGAAFRELVQSSPPPDFVLNFKPEPQVTAPDVVLDHVVPSGTTLQFSGDLARRPLLSPLVPPSFPRNDVLEPSTVQALVDSAGNVASAVVLQSSGDNDADQLALKLVRQLRFAPAPNLMFGEISWVWHTVPTNAVPATAP